MLARRSREASLPDVTLGGAHLMLAWQPGGATRACDRRGARFRSPAQAPGSPDTHRGTWQVGIRLSHVDPSDADADADVDGGRETNLGLALTWPRGPYLRVMANVTRVLDLESPICGCGDRTPLTFHTRVQLAF